MADKVIENFQGSFEERIADGVKEKLREDIAGCFNCQISKVSMDEKEKSVDIEVPIEGVIACGAFLGIKDEDNVIMYRNKVWKK